MRANEISRERITETDALIRPHIRETPVIETDGADIGIGPARVVFKLELLQHTGSFKARGAFANLLMRRVPPAGVVAASGGNHGAAVAFAAQKLGKKAKIFVPRIASQTKIERIRSYGAELVITGQGYAEALAESEKWHEESGAMPLHAYDQVETMLGQGTVGLEFEKQEPKLDTLLVAVGGGGLIGGISAWYGGKVKIIGVEPERAPSLARALASGRPVDVEVGGIAADSLGAKRVGNLMFPVAQKHVERVVLVTDEAIEKAQRALWNALRIVAEPGGAAAFAALLSHRYEAKSGERIGIIVCGGNTTAVNFGPTAKAGA
ncbi:MAG TPA: threonine/serine dehydratase [Candidatus Acidoferrales bacterium]|nr:threonine/serine dehydratase [Candidatus Acidoferrales bacterium]